MRQSELCAVTVFFFFMPLCVTQSLACDESALVQEGAHSKRLDRLIERRGDAASRSLSRGRDQSLPNVVLILTDDQSVDTIQHMPYLAGRIADRGIAFDRAFITNPVCAPARGSILSGGFHSHETGVKTNGALNGGLTNLEESRTLATYLQARGYSTGFVGKYIHGYIPGYVPPGWTRFVANENGGMLRDYWQLRNITYGSSTARATKGEVRFTALPKKQYITGFQTEEAIKFIEDFRNTTFFLLLSYYAPHPPFIVEEYADQLYSEGLDYVCLDLRRQGEVPTWARVAAQSIGAENPSTCGRVSFDGQVALLQSVDRGVGRIFETLARTGVADRTIVVFSSDNGIVLGRRELYADKGMPYEGAIRVPLAMFVPGELPRQSFSLVAANLDIPATIFDIAGIDAPSEGVSLMQELLPGSAVERDHLLIESYGYLNWHNRAQGHPLPPVIWSGLRTQKWKYVEYVGGDRELFDLTSDANERVNLVSETAYADVLGELSKLLALEKGLAITNGSLPPAVVGRAYAAQLAHWGGRAPVTWNVESGNLPRGLTLDANTGKIRGRAEEPGSYHLVVRATDSGKGKHTHEPDTFAANFILEVCAANTTCP